MRSRSAVDVIKGYFYQFDNTIYRILNLPKNNNFIDVECIEDIDVNISDEILAVQCKYYSRTEYNHSVLKEAIIQMLSHFAARRRAGNEPIDYLIHAHFNSGREKLPSKIDISFLKDNFLTLTENKIINGKKTQNKTLYHENLNLDDRELQAFLDRLKINIYAADFQKQFLDIISDLQRLFNCKQQEAELIYYNNALKVIKDLSIQREPSARRISKKDFLQKINVKKIIFNLWFQQLKTKSNFYKLLRSEYFTSLNVSPFERFFILEIDSSNYNRSSLKEILFNISKKWSKTSKYEANPFCPYVYLHNIPSEELVKLKGELYAEDYIVIDGYNFEGATFNAKLISKKIERTSKIKLKMLNSIKNIDETLAIISKTRQIYQFYINEPFYELDSNEIKHVKIQLDNLDEIKYII